MANGTLIHPGQPNVDCQMPSDSLGFTINRPDNHHQMLTCIPNLMVHSLTTGDLLKDSHPCHYDQEMKRLEALCHSAQTSGLHPPTTVFVNVAIRGPYAWRLLGRAWIPADPGSSTTTTGDYVGTYAI